MLSIYPAVFFEEAESGYSVIFPDLNGAVTQGDDLNEAMSMAVDCLAGYLYTLKLEGMDAPAASPVNAIDTAAVAADFDYNDYKSALVNMVSVDVEMYAQLHFNKSVRKTVTIPQWMADTAAVRKLSLSKVLQESLKERFAVPTNKKQFA